MCCVVHARWGLGVQFLKNQVAKEIGLSLASIPFMGALTTPIILAEIYGYSKCYDNVRPPALPPPLHCAHLPHPAHSNTTAVPPNASRFVLFLTPFSFSLRFLFIYLFFPPNLVSLQVEEYGLPFLIMTIFTFLFFTDCGIYWIHRALHSRCVAHA
jgi:hypothetical protein